MIRKSTILTLVTLLLSLFGCRKPFDPETIKGFSSALIVEGVINPTGVTRIYLSRTLDLDDKVSVKPELKAIVQVVSENNTVQSLAEGANGLYSLAQLSLNSSQKYRLKVKTSDGREYQSDLLTVRNTPPIDSFEWVREPNGVGIYISTHDNQNGTKYYQWDFEENWELRSKDEAMYTAVNAVTGGGVRVVARDPKEVPLMFTCYKFQRSTNIDIVSTAKLSADVVAKHPIVFIPNGSEKLDVRYSILIRQYAITFEAFEYLSMMKRNSEQLGSFFDAQPTELIGNIRNINDPKDVAIGFVTIAPVLEKRIFITKADVPGWTFRLNCLDIVVKNHPDSLARYFGPGNSSIPQYPGTNSQGAVEQWNGTSAACMDCRIRGGNNDKPSFW
jgi:hypothetical protein